MEPFPTELWLEIIKTLRKKDWLALSATCHFLHIISQAALYETVHICEGLFFRNKQIPQFCRTIKERPDLGGLVRTLKLTPIELQDGKPGLLGSHPIFPLLPSFTRLRVLELVQFELDANICSTLCSLPRLVAVHFVDCNSDEKFMRDHIEFALRAMMDKLVGLFKPGLVDEQAPNPPALRSLNIKRFRKGDWFTGMIISHFTLRRWTTALTSLNLQGPTIPMNIIPFLMNAPRLQSISLPDYVIPDAEHELHSLPADSLPLLQHFSGPAECCDLFVRGRPVHTVELSCCNDTATDVLVSLNSSSAAVTRLKLKMSFYDPAEDKGKVILQHAPVTLRHLSWERSVHKSHVISWGTVLSRLKNLQTIEGTCSNCPDPGNVDHLGQTDVVTTIAAACPSLREFTFAHGNPDNDRWVRRRDDTWERYVQEVGG